MVKAPFTKPAESSNTAELYVHPGIREHRAREDKVPVDPRGLKRANTAEIPEVVS
jgi:hypothetical protein